MNIQPKLISPVEAVTLFISGDTQTLSRYAFTHNLDTTDLLEEGFNILLKKRKHTMNPDELENALVKLKDQYKSNVTRLLERFDTERIEQQSNQFNRIYKLGNEYYKKLTGQL